MGVDAIFSLFETKLIRLNIFFPTTFVFVYPIFSLLLRLSDPHGSSLARVCV